MHRRADDADTVHSWLATFMSRQASVRSDSSFSSSGKRRRRRKLDDMQQSINLFLADLRDRINTDRNFCFTTMYVSYRGQPLAVICNGVAAVESAMGWSLMATRDFPAGHGITQYVGEVISYDEARRRSSAGRGSHLCSFKPMSLCVDGLKYGVPGLGGASLANHSSTNSNAKYLLLPLQLCLSQCFPHLFFC